MGRPDDGLESGQIDAIIAGMSPTAERALTSILQIRTMKANLSSSSERTAFMQMRRLLPIFRREDNRPAFDLPLYVIDQIPGVIKMNAMETFLR
jgi:hypothetical protein